MGLATRVGVPNESPVVTYRFANRCDAPIHLDFALDFARVEVRERDASLAESRLKLAGSVARRVRGVVQTLRDPL